MEPLDPETLLGNTALVRAVAPWCVRLDGLELAILLLAQPWLAGGGLRRADLEHRLARLAGELPIGPVYFQRVSRAVARLEEVGAIEADGTGRAKRFRLAPAGLAALMLNLRVLGADPTIDGSEFELKRSLVAVSNLVLERFSDLPEEVPVAPAINAFFDEVERLEVWGHRVVTEQLLQQCFDVLALIDLQRQRVQRMLEEAQARLQQLGRSSALVQGVDLAKLADTLTADDAGPDGRAVAAATLRELAGGALRGLGLRAAALRYRRYLEYLDDLTAVYAAELRESGHGALRLLVGRRAG